MEEEYPIKRDELYELLRNNGVYTRKYFYPLTSDQACFNNKYQNVKLDCAKQMSKQVLVLPIYENLRVESIKKIVAIICENG